jgi:DNA primase
VENVVATCGTSLTLEHAILIKKNTNNLTILYDGDAAGIKAALRGLETVLEQGLNLKIVLLPDGEDPDSYIRKVGADEFKIFVETEAKDFILFKAKLLLDDAKNDPVKKAEFVTDIIKSIAKIPDAIKRSMYVKECSNLMGLDEQLLITEVNKLKRKEYYDKTNIAPGDKELLEKGYEETRTQEFAERILDENLSLYISEKEICRILLEKGKEEFEEGMNVATFVMTELEDVGFYDVNNKRFFDYFKSLFEKQLVMDTNYYEHHEQKEIRDFAIGLSLYPYEMANWNNKTLEINLPDWNENYIKDIVQTISLLKIFNIKKLKKENQLKIKQAEENKDDEALTNALKVGVSLNKIETEIALSIGKVV